MKDGVFIAVETDRDRCEELQCLSTHVMRWTERVWILDWTSFQSFWCARAESQGQDVLLTLKHVLDHVFGQSTASSVIDFTSSYRAVSADHPWKAILFLQYMTQRNMRGFLHVRRGLGETLYSEIDWEAWWESLEVLSTHYSEQKKKGFKPATFKRQSELMKRSMLRMNLDKPSHLKGMSEHAVRRRYGQTIGDAFLWSYETLSKHRDDFLPRDFPWKNFSFSKPITVQNTLDYGLLLWDHIKPFLKLDFERLCFFLKDSSSRVTRIEWTLQRDDQTCLSIPIVFRNPHNLLKEKGTHQSALLQAEYSFLSHVASSMPQTPREIQQSTLQVVALITGWTLEVSGLLKLPQGILDLFGDWEGSSQEDDELSRLENELPVALSRYRVKEDWIPEDSFEAFSWGDVWSHDQNAGRSLIAAAYHRPFFIGEPRRIRDDISVSQRIYLETIMSKWWKDPLASEHQDTERHYYRYLDAEQRTHWIFRNARGQWYWHGLFN